MIRMSKYVAIENGCVTITNPKSFSKPTLEIDLSSYMMDMRGKTLIVEVEFLKDLIQRFELKRLLEDDELKSRIETTVYTKDGSSYEEGQE